MKASAADPPAAIAASMLEAVGMSKSFGPVPVDVLYPPAMVATALELTAANFYNQAPVRGSYILDATLVTTAHAKDFYFPDSPF